jgi:hypothetical protein
MPNHGIALSALVLLIAACSDRQVSDEGVLSGTWGSNQAGLRITDNAATLQIMADGNCYGSYAVTSKPIPIGQFALAGTYTQLTGAYPGKVDYPAQLTGTVTGSQLSIAISVSSLQRTVGPFNLIRGVDASWTACPYP